MSKTREIIDFIDFKHDTVYCISSYMTKMFRLRRPTNLGTMFDSKLKFDFNTESFVKQEHQMICLLRNLNVFSDSERILSNFYCSFIRCLFNIFFYLFI